jgi:hypothetical protein
VRSLAAFEQSSYADDWRDLMRLYMVHRSRSFIQDNYADMDAATGRKYLTFADGTRSYFPTRQPKTLKFAIDDNDLHDQYAFLYSDLIVATINRLALPRYSLGNYVQERPHEPPTAAEARVIADLSRAGKRLMGFCRTNLFKRLESSGQAFIQSVERHILRNFVYLHAIEQDQPLPIGTQDASALDVRFNDADAELFVTDDDEEATTEDQDGSRLRSDAEFRRRAAEIYSQYAGPPKNQFRWLRPDWFQSQLADDLQQDSASLLAVLQRCGDWNPARDAKLAALARLISGKHRGEKLIVFSQFADTVCYLAT